MPFSPQTLDFLFENHLQDSRAWFEAHKGEYREFVIAPLRELTEALTPCMLQIDSRVTTEPRVDKTICRIWRDTRFSHDKSLYRDTMWIIFKRGKMHGTDVPGFYFEISEEGFNYGCGFYSASTAYMNHLRALALAGNPSFARAMEAFEAQSLYHMEGECYKRPHYAGQPEELRRWLERRNLCFVAESNDFDLLFSNRLAEKLSEDFTLLKPIYEFMMEAAALTLRQEEKELHA